MVYTLMLFLIGFVIGTIHMLLLIVPLLGQTTAIILETPIMLAASWLVCGWCVDRVDVPRRIGPRSLMGMIAFGVLIGAEFALGRFGFRKSIGEQLVGYGSAA